MAVAAVVITRRELPYARVLAADLAAHAPGLPLTALLLDPDAAPLDAAMASAPSALPGAAGAPERFELLELAAVEPEPAALLVLDPEALRELARVRLVEQLLTRGEDVVLLEPELAVRGALTALLTLAREHGAALVPRLAEPRSPDDDKEPSEADIAAAGLYRSGQLAVAASPAGRDFAAWWRAEAGAAPDPLDRAPLLFDGVAVLRDSAYGVAAWNLHARAIDAGAAGPTVDGRPLQTLFLPGFDPERPYWLGTRVRVEGALEALLAERAQQLLDAGQRRARELPWGYARLPNGLALDAPLRAILADAQTGDPFTLAGADRLLAEALGPAPRGAAHGVNCYLYALWRERGDLRDAFPELDSRSGEAYVRWALANAAAEGVPTALLPEDPDPDVPRRLGVNVAGYLSAALGIGEAGRLYVTALQAAGIPVRTDALEPPRADAVGSLRPARGCPPLDGGADFPLNLVCVNAPQLPGFARQLGEDFFADRRTIGVWAWEASQIPATWEESFAWVDEIWTYSSYVAALIAPRSPVPVVALPLPLVLPPPASEPLALDLPDRFTFLFMFDFLSTAERKNPVGLVEAYTRAFGPGDGAQLVVKSFNGDYKPEQLERLRRAADGRDDVILLDCWLSAEQRRALMERADCYVSLHRSEGFGLTLAEAMGLGKPVVATGYSGNLDFMDAGSAYLVDFTLVPVGPGVDIYPADGVWADPDLDHAAEQLRRVRDRPDEAAERAERGRRRVLDQLSPAACGARARDRLELLAADMPAAPQQLDPLGARVQRAVERAAYDPLDSAAGTHPKDLARRAALHAMRPFTFHQRELNGLLVDVLAETTERVRELESALARRTLQTRRAEWRLRHVEARLERLDGSD